MKEWVCIWSLWIKRRRLQLRLSNKNPSKNSRFTHRLLGDPILRARGLADIGIALNMRAQRALSNWRPNNNYLFTVWLIGSVYLNRDVMKCHCYSSKMCAAIDFSSPEANDELYRNHHYSQVSVQWTLWSLLMIRMPNFATYQMQNGTSGASFLFLAIGPI